jgi:hypothetical protein
VTQDVQSPCSIRKTGSVLGPLVVFAQVVVPYGPTGMVAKDAVLKRPLGVQAPILLESRRECGRDRNDAHTPSFRCVDRLAPRRLLDSQQATNEVDVAPPQRNEFAAPQSCVASKKNDDERPHVDLLRCLNEPRLLLELVERELEVAHLQEIERARHRCDHFLPSIEEPMARAKARAADKAKEVKWLLLPHPSRMESVAQRSPCCPCVRSGRTSSFGSQRRLSGA